MRAEQTVTLVLTEKEARAYCLDVEAVERVLDRQGAGFREPRQVRCIADALRDMGLGPRGSYDVPDVPAALTEDGRVTCAGSSRSAVVYPVAGSSPVMWRVRAEKHPDDEPGWSGGKVLWGHDQPTREEAAVIGAAWAERGELPVGFDQRPSRP